MNVSRSLVRRMKHVSD